MSGFDFFLGKELIQTDKICHFTDKNGCLGNERLTEQEAIRRGLEIIPCHLCWGSRKLTPSNRPAPSECGERRAIHRD